MIRSNKLIPAGALALMLTIGGGCKKSFLDENQISSKTTQDYVTTVGLDQLATGMYQSLRFHFNYEWAYTSTNYGVDEFTAGGDLTYEMWNSYGSTLNSQTQDIRTVWDNMYGAINSANILLQNVPVYYDGSQKNTRLGEAYFMRAFNYFKLVNQYGGVPLKLIPSTEVDFEFPRNSVKEVYDQITSDMKQAYDLLPATPVQRGRITKWAAAHYLSKIYLFRASEVNASWNSANVAADLDNAIKFGTDVINNSGHKLASNFTDLWNYTVPNSLNESNAEIILSAQFSDNVSTQGRYGNQMHLYYPSVYQNLAGMVRDLPGGREFQRLRSTDYALDVYDRVNDSRFWKSFKTRYSCNNPSGAPKWEATYAPAGQTGKAKFGGGDTSILYIVNNSTDTRYTKESIKYRSPHMFVRYFNGEAENMLGGHGNYEASRYVGLSKFMDGSRADVANQFGRRDGILARLADTYLMVAEAYGRKGQYVDALPFINAIRDRAAYRAKEDRSFYVDGGIAYKNNPAASTATYVSLSDKNTYYESNGMVQPLDTNTNASTVSAMHINSVNDILASTREFYDKLKVSSDMDRFLCFILNERSRELMGELQRWDDLTRTRTLVTRCAAFNALAKPTAPKDYLRPIPQSFLDVIKENGQPLTADQKAAYQNAGW
ncbi:MULTISPECIES: RagB/SusD family nutrient uptake outer membrane protein [Niastella]|uniref:RagB/SusD family nutrient uptake outer membrane protein n=1 Tax=Niastella soli TaxID=2821487 RepID=A0ABS3YVG8_9BACT|nr:RagB/SusD family nutrient uptake outer membrane protein [Niastella soli]MBO9201858.1 RagB/SusD family nutrient uptake outer membrane protein [Niastella soli]